MLFSLGRHAAKAALLIALLTFPIPATAAEPLSGNFLAAVIATSEPHRDSLIALLKGRRGLPSWVRNMVSQPRYVALASQEVSVGDRPMQLFAACDPVDCPTSAIRLLFSADGAHVVARIVDGKAGTQLLGMPSAAELVALERPAP